MTPWTQRSHEERTLLNPGFCGFLLWHAAVGYASKSDAGLSFEESFLVMPFVLHRETRESLPRTIRTSLAVWLQENPLARGHIAIRAKALVPFTKEALTFAGVYGLVQLRAGRLTANVDLKKAATESIRESSDEVRECAKRAHFIGTWFSQAGNPATVLALLGVRP